MYSHIDNSWENHGDDIDGEFSFDSLDNSVDISNDDKTVAFCATYNDVNGIPYWNSWVYSYNDNSWFKVGNDIDEENACDLSGNSVAIYGNGKTVASGNSSTSGHIRVYTD